MKKLQFLFYSLMLITAFACSKSNTDLAYETENHTDANGFNYETVSNDPTGLRLDTLDNGMNQQVWLIIWSTCCSKELMNSAHQTGSLKNL